MIPGLQQNRDFRNWVAFETRKPEGAPKTVDMWEAYKGYYTCDCESCVDRMIHGFHPMRLRPGCNAPMVSISVDLVARR